MDPDKVRVILEMPYLCIEKQVRGFLGRLNYIARFISQLIATCEPIFRLLRKNQVVEWNEDCQNTFDKIKGYLKEPPILRPPVPGRPLILYLMFFGVTRWFTVNLMFGAMVLSIQDLDLQLRFVALSSSEGQGCDLISFSAINGLALSSSYKVKVSTMIRCITLSSSKGQGYDVIFWS